MARRDEEERDEAKATLRRLGAEGDLLGGAGRSRIAAHFAADDADPKDAAEVWGRRIGRGLSLAVTIGLIGWLVVTYL